MPISVYSCNACGIVQLDQPYDEEYADDYQRNTSFSPSALEAMRRHVDLVRACARRSSDASALEIGCGDGTFLKMLSEHFRTVGVEPSRAAAALAREKGLVIRNEYFDPRSIGGPFDVVVLRFVLEHIFDINPFLDGVASAVKPGGLCVLELPNYSKMVEDVRFFEFYREHILYFDATSMAVLMARHGFRLIHARPFMNDEYLLGIFEYRPAPPAFDEAAQRISGALASMLGEPGVQDIAFWGASGGGVSLLSYSGIPLDRVRYIIDSDPNKHGLFVYGVGARIVSPEALRASKHPDAIVILSPTYEEEIAKTLRGAYDFRGRLGSVRGIPHWLGSS